MKLKCPLVSSNCSGVVPVLTQLITGTDKSDLPLGMCVFVLLLLWLISRRHILPRSEGRNWVGFSTIGLADFLLSAVDS